MHHDLPILGYRITPHTSQLSSHSSLVYAVPDASTDCSVRLLFTAVKDKSLISIIPGVAFYDTYLASSLPFLSDHADDNCGDNANQHGADDNCPDIIGNPLKHRIISLLDFDILCQLI